MTYDFYAHFYLKKLKYVCVCVCALQNEAKRRKKEVKWSERFPFCYTFDIFFY